MSVIKNKFPTAGLVILGGGRNSEEHKIRELIKVLGVSDVISLQGRVNKNQVPKYLFSAVMLVLARPKSLQAEGGFPTKLGEYLLSGKPVICTRVGEIPKHLKNRKDAYLIEPDSVTALENAISEILTNAEVARKIGLNGKKIGEMYFSAQKQAKLIKTLLIRDLSI